jgi:branched-chain amino acid transport system substrate-binding protein
MRKRMLFLSCILVLAGSFLFFSCQEKKGQSAEAGRKKDQATTQEDSSLAEGEGRRTVAVDQWNIPFLNSLTGPIASIGEYLQWGAERAAEEINEQGGIAGKPVRIQAIDTGVSPEKGAVEMARVTEAASLTALGPVPEPVIMAAMPIAVEAEMMAFTATTSYEYAVEFFPWAISWFASTEQKLPPVAAEWAGMHPQMQRVVQFVENYGPWPGMADAHEIGLKESGKTVLEEIEIPTDAVTFGSFIVKALAQEPDGIILACHPEKTANIIKELQNRGWKDTSKILIFNSADDAALYTTGGSALNGCIIYNYTNPELDTPRWNAFKEAYKEDHDGMSPPSLATHYYDAVYMIKEAIEHEGITGSRDVLQKERELLAEYCRNVENFEGIQFTWSMKDGVPTDKPLFLFEIQNGEKELIKEIRPE